MDIQEEQAPEPRPQPQSNILTAVSKEPIIPKPNPDIPSPEFYVPSNIVDSPEKREAFLEMCRKEEENNQDGGSGGLSLLTDVATEESEESGEFTSNDDGERKFIINN
jgi:hypothetical protein